MIDPILEERRGDVVIVTMNLHERRNALGATLYPALSRAVTELQDDMSVRALVLYGGPHFCAGGDLSALDASPLAMREAMQVGHRAIRALTGGRLPAVAAVCGTAFGAGFSLAMACDFVVAHASATFCAAFGKVGLTPDYGLLWTLPQRVGIARARELLMLCPQIRGDEAIQLRLVDRLVDEDKVLDEAIALADRLAAAPPATIATMKAVLSRLPLSLDTMLAWEADTQALLARTHDVHEGVRAFKERRAPTFKGE